MGYDPTNPPDPEMGYRLTVKASPETGGNVTPSRPQYVKAGESVRIEANPRLGYAFRAWMDGDQVVSTDQYFYFTMPENAVALTAWFDKTEYNPTNPGDPFIEGYEHRVSIYSSPSIGGNSNMSNFYMREGDEAYLYAYPNTAFKFVCWKQNGEIISTDRELRIKMGDKNLEYTMQFAYYPTNPSDPGTNSWNAATGELIMDHFSRGNLWGAINDMVGNDGLESVSELTVIGPIDDYDFNTVSQMPGLTLADFSRTSGCSFVPNSAFCNNEALTKILLPSSISWIDTYAFIGCQNLSELVVYAAMPPQVYEETFYGVPENMVVKVYSSSLDIYQNAPVWSNFKIMTIDDDSTALSVTLPADAADGRYRNASLQLSNLSTGQTQKLVVTGSRTKFVFGNLIPDMRYSLYALAPNGCVIGSFLDFEIPAEGVDLQFDSLLQLKDVKLALLTPEGEDVADRANVSWFDEKHSLLGSGATLSGQVEGYTVYYEMSLPRDLGILYATPEKGEWKVVNGENTVSLTLVPFATTEIKGTLTDDKFDEPVGGGYVTVSQMLNGYAVSSSAVTNADGSYVLTMYDVPGTLTAGSPDHFETSAEFANAQEAASLAGFRVKPLAGVEVYLSLLSRDNIVKGSPANEFTDYADYANVDFTVYNNTTNKAVENVRLKYPKLIIFDDIADGDVLDITATPKNSAFNAAKETVIVANGAADAEIAFTSNGDIAASYSDTEAEEVVALLYGSDGNLLKTISYADKKADFLGLSNGAYTLVSMMACKLFSSAGTLQELYDTYLEAGKDYVVSPVTVETGYITEVVIPNVPVFDETAFYYTSPETTISVNKTSVTVGNIVTVRSNVKFLPEYDGQIEKVKITFNIPEGCDYVENSLLVSGDDSNVTTIEGETISVEVPLKDASPRFCIIPRKGGEYRPSASIEFEYDGQIIRQPIGFALFNAGDFTLSVPAKTSVPRITARGAATPLSDVRVYDNDMFIGSTRSLTNGDWRLTFDLYNPGDYSEHMIYAEISTPEGIKYRTTVAKTIYDKDWAELTDIHMIYGGTTVDFNHIDATTVPGSYSYVPGNDMFTFKAIFREGHAAKVDRLEFVILLSDGSRRKIEGKYLKSQDAWVCALGFPDVNRLPVNVKVLYTELRHKEEGVIVDLIDDVTEAFRCPDVIPIIDPSGYVYEAVPSNRLQGVTATIFYKEYVEDMYGDLHETEVKWDAEAYAQENPVFTDEEGMYQWDVPQGEWQVRFEKEGYETTSTDWLPVPPPQLDINVGMTQTVRPEVIDAKAYEQAVEVEFDKYMDLTSLNASNIAVVVNGENVEGSILFLDEEAAPEGVGYASKVRFEAADPFAAKEVTLMVANKVRSYAGISMEESFTQEFTVEPEISAIEAPEKVEAYIGMPVEVKVNVAPAEASAGKTLVVEINTPIAAISESVEIAEDGSAAVTVNGELPGAAIITYRVEGSSYSVVSTSVEFTVAPEPAEAPVASVESGTMVPVGTEVILTSATEGAQIWYTLDGTSPIDSNSMILYVAPVVIKEATKILAVAVAKGYLESEVAEFNYTVPAPLAAPVASVATGTEVEEGTEVSLTTSLVGAEIWYTLDGTSPLTSESRMKYAAPIVINVETTILAVAHLEGYPDSEVVEFHYTIEERSGVDSVSSANLKIEAAGNEIRISGVNGREAVVYVYDATGKTVMPAMRISRDEAIRIDGSLQGVCIIKVVTDNETTSLKARR